MPSSVRAARVDQQLPVLGVPTGTTAQPYTLVQPWTCLRAATRAPGAVDHQLSGPQLSVPRVPSSAFVRQPSSGEYGAFRTYGGLTGDALAAQLQQTAEKFGAACVGV